MGDESSYKRKSNSRLMVSVGDETSDKCTIGRGVRQWFSLSPVLFNIYGEMLIQEALQYQRSGIVIGGRTVKSVRFALQQTLSSLNDVVEDYGMRINKRKTKVRKISRNSQEEVNIHIKGKKLEEVNQYKYLGSILDSESRSTN